MEVISDDVGSACRLTVPLECTDARRLSFGRHTGPSSRADLKQFSCKGTSTPVGRTAAGAVGMADAGAAARRQLAEPAARRWR